MQIYFVEGHNSVFVQAETPQQALKIAIDKDEVQMWAMPRVFLTEWRDNILYAVGMPVLEDQSFWDEDTDGKGSE